MREGDKITCPSCGVESIVKSTVVMSDDWSSKRKVFVCAFCRAELGEENSGSSEQAAVSAQGASSRLAALLGDDVESAESAVINVEPDDVKLCRNCRHLAVHPFKMVCLITQNEVDPMDDCEKFEKKTK